MFLISLKRTLINLYTPIGASLHENGQCFFTVWAPLCNAVSVVILTSPEVTWSIGKSEMGYWCVIVDHVTPEMQYGVLLDNSLLRPDPASRWQPNGVHGPSAVVNTNFNWTDEHWQGIELAGNRI
ncbi:MAG TPA: hypothetical protein VF008_12905 [Niastella sp.]